MLKRLNQLSKREDGFSLLEAIAGMCITLLLGTLGIHGIEQLTSQVNTLLPANAGTQVSCFSDVLTSNGLTMPEAATKVANGTDVAFNQSLAKCAGVNSTSATPVDYQWVQDELNNL